MRNLCNYVTKHPHFFLLRIIIIFIYSQEAVTSKIHFITTSKHSDGPYPCSSLRTALSRRLGVTIIGLSEGNNRTNAYGDTSMHQEEPYMIMEHFDKVSDQTYKDDDIIVFNRRDVLYATDSSQLEIAFLRTEKIDTILFAAERECWPPDAAGCREPPRDVKSSYKYLFSGGWVARYKVARDFMQLYIEALASIPVSLGRYEQRALHGYTLRTAGKLELYLDIDYNCTIFQTSTKSLLAGKEWWLSPDQKDGPYMQPDGKVSNLETNSYPLLYHFNTGNDEDILDIEALLWMKTKLLNSDYMMQCESYLKKYSALSLCQERGIVKKIVPFYCDATTIANIESRVYAEKIEDITRRQNKSNIHHHDKRDQINPNYLFPVHIPHYRMRKDPRTKQSVVSGRSQLLKSDTKYPLLEYKEILQCSEIQPELYGKGGALSLAKKIPLTRETIILVAAYVESKCTLWNDCRNTAKQFLKGDYPLSNIHDKMGGFYASKLFRIINGSYYYDWPWGRHRVDGTRYTDNGRLVIKHVLKYVSDLKDSVFFYGGEMATLPPGIPVPHFSSSPEGSKSSDIPGLWNAAFIYELRRYEANKYTSVWMEREILLRGNQSITEIIYERNLNNGNMTDMVELKSWSSRIDKGAFFGTMINSYFAAQDHIIARQVVINMAIDHPEHLVANFTSCSGELTGTNMELCLSLSPSLRLFLPLYLFLNT